MRRAFSLDSNFLFVAEPIAMAVPRRKTKLQYTRHERLKNHALKPLWPEKLRLWDWTVPIVGLVSLLRQAQQSFATRTRSIGQS